MLLLLLNHILSRTCRAFPNLGECRRIYRLDCYDTLKCNNIQRNELAFVDTIIYLLLIKIQNCIAIYIKDEVE